MHSLYLILINAPLRRRCTGFSTTQSSARVRNCLEKLLAGPCYLVKYGHPTCWLLFFWWGTSGHLSGSSSPGRRLHSDCSAAVNVACSRKKNLPSAVPHTRCEWAAAPHLGLAEPFAHITSQSSQFPFDEMGTWIWFSERSGDLNYNNMESPWHIKGT